MQNEQILDPDQPISLQEMGLTQEELGAKAHWKEFLPTLTQQLNQRSPDALDEAIRKASHAREYGISLTLVRNPKLHRMQVEELFNDVLWPPPEPSRPRATPRQTSS